MQEGGRQGGPLIGVLYSHSRSIHPYIHVIDVRGEGPQRPTDRWHFYNMHDTKADRCPPPHPDRGGLWTPPPPSLLLSPPAHSARLSYRPQTDHWNRRLYRLFAGTLHAVCLPACLATCLSVCVSVCILTPLPPCLPCLRSAAYEFVHLS